MASFLVATEQKTKLAVSVWLIPFPRLSVKLEQKAVDTFVSIGC